MECGSEQEDRQVETDTGGRVELAGDQAGAREAGGLGRTEPSPSCPGDALGADLVFSSASPHGLGTGWWSGGEGVTGLPPVTQVDLAGGAQVPTTPSAPSGTA